MNLRTQVLSGLAWIGGARLLGQLLTWAITLVVIRLLSPSDYGLLAMATVFMSFLALLAEAGLGDALVQAREMPERKLRQIFGAVILVDVSLFVLQFAAAPAIAAFFAEDRLVLIIRALAVQFLLMIFTVIPIALLTRSLNFKRQSMIDLVSAICASVTTLILALADFNVWALVIGNLVGIAVRSVAINLLSPYLKWPDFRLAGLGGIMAYGGKVTVTRLFWFMYTQGDSLIVGKLLGKEPLGFYSVSMHLASLPVQRISSVLNQVAFPAFASVQHDRQQAALYLMKAVRILSFLAFPVLWGMSSVAPEMVTVLLGPKWEQAVLPIQVLTLVVALRVVNVVLGTAVDGLGRPDVNLSNVLVANLVMLPAFAVGANWGLVGISLAWLFVYPIVTLQNWNRILPILDLKVKQMLRAMLPSAACALGMYAVVAALRRYVTLGENGLPQLVTLAAAGAVVYALLSLALNLEVCKEILRLRKPS